MKSSYQVEQLEALARVRLHLAALPRGERETLCVLAADYLAFRRRVDDFQDRNFGSVCDRTCYQSQLSACCSREGIVTFFADMVINLTYHAVVDGHGFAFFSVGQSWVVTDRLPRLFAKRLVVGSVFPSLDKVPVEWRLPLEFACL